MLSRMREGFFLPVFFMFLMFFGIFFIVIYKKKQIEYNLILTDGEELKCDRISSYSNGMTFVKTIEGKEITIPTIRIKEISEIEKK